MVGNPPLGADAVVFSQVRGAEDDATSSSTVVYGDGKVIRVDRSSFGKPVRIFQAMIDDAVLSRVLRAAKKYGVLSESFDAGDPREPLGNVSFGVHAFGRQHVQTYRLGALEDPGLNTSQRTLRSNLEYQVLGPLSDALFEPMSGNKDGLYPAARTAVLFTETAAAEGEKRTHTEDWPLTPVARARPWQRTAADGSRCLVFDSQRLGGILRTEKSIRELMSADSPAPVENPVRWRSGGRSYDITVHPMLPDEGTNCSTVRPYFEQRLADAPK